MASIPDCDLLHGPPIPGEPHSFLSWARRFFAWAHLRYQTSLRVSFRRRVALPPDQLVECRPNPISMSRAQCGVVASFYWPRALAGQAGVVHPFSRGNPPSFWALPHCLRQPHMEDGSMGATKCPIRGLSRRPSSISAQTSDGGVGEPRKRSEGKVGGCVVNLSSTL